MIDLSNAATRADKVKIITKELEKGIDELFHSDKYAEFLSKMSQLHHYSFGNTMLILSQKPDAEMVAGVSTWNKAFGRYVKKGEKGIVILAPAEFKKNVTEKLTNPDGTPKLNSDNKQIEETREVTIQYFKPAYVFDVSQTDGKPVPKLGVDELTGKVANYPEVFDAVCAAAPVKITFEDIKSGAKGYYNSDEKRIVINHGMSDLQTLKTAIHETAHSILHDKDYIKSTGEMKDASTREVEAESVAYSVCSYFGLPTEDYSFGYIAGWAGSRKTEAVRESMETIQHCSSDIISKMEQNLGIEKIPQIEQIQQRHKVAAI